MGIFKLLDSQCKTPKATDLKFCAQVYQEHGKHPCLLVPKRRPREDVEFTVKHFAGDVRYACGGARGGAGGREEAGPRQVGGLHLGVAPLLRRHQRSD